LAASAFPARTLLAPVDRPLCVSVPAAEAVFVVRAMVVALRYDLLHRAAGA